MKKNFLPYLPASLVCAKDRWYIKFYQTDPASGSRKKIKQTFDLNRVKSITTRRELAKEIIARINSLLPLGYPFVTEYMGNRIRNGASSEKYFRLVAMEPLEHKVAPLLMDALKEARDIKTNTRVEQTNKSNRSFLNEFEKFLKRRKLTFLLLEEFTRAHARDFLDYKKKADRIANRTYNNYRILGHGIWKLFNDKEYLDKNPFSGIKDLPLSRQTRMRKLTEYEQKAIIKHIKANHPQLFMAIILQFCCLLRPIEVMRLKYGYFDLKKNLIEVPEDFTKNSRKNFKTIPNSVIHFFDEEHFNSTPEHWYLFPAKNVPGAPKHLHHNTMYNRHKAVLHKLHDRGILENLKGLTLYSWKYTSISKFLKILDPVSVRDQADHQDLQTTMGYYEKSLVNEEFLNVEIDLFK